jgi:hypothetical protein
VRDHGIARALAAGAIFVGAEEARDANDQRPLAALVREALAPELAR